ncbi:MAG: hypothetical protein WBG38_07105 [Nodosilinea sp.]
MSSPSQLEKAKCGDAAAIAALISQALQPQGITVRGDLYETCLRLWLTGLTLPPQAQSVSCVCRGLERLQVETITGLHIYGEQADQPPGWGVEVALGVPNAEVRPLNLSPQAAVSEAGVVEPAADAAPESSPSGSADAAYSLLELAQESSLKEVEGAYFKLKAQAIRLGDRSRVEVLKRAFSQLKNHIENPPVPELPPQAEAGADEATPLTSVERVQALLKRQRFSAQVSIQGRQLRISWLAVRVANPDQAARQIRALLLSEGLATLGLEDTETLAMFGLSRDQSVVWQQALPLQTKA